MRIDRLHLRNYRSVEKIDIELHDSLNVIVGNNGSGKSTILDGLAVAIGTWLTGFDGIPGVSIRSKDARLIAYQMGETNDPQPQYPVIVAAEGNVDNRSIIWERTLTYSKGQTTTKGAKELLDLAKRYQERIRIGDRDVVLPMIAYYGTGRLWDYHREKKADVFHDGKKTNGYIDCLSGSANLKLMMNWFRKRTIQLASRNEFDVGDQGLQLRVVYNAMAKCLNNSKDIKESRFRYDFDTNELYCYYRDDNGLVMKVPLSQMSDGYKSTISLIADIAYRMTVLNPQLGEAVLSETTGVILIDEIDLHLHPAWQHMILSDLRNIFPKIQFIVSTHAPAVISSVKKENLIILENNVALHEPYEVYGKDVNSLLSEVMGADDRNPFVADMFGKFKAALDSGNYKEAEEILENIDSLRGHHDKEVMTNRIILDMERIRGLESD